jgi:hypothetical protein
VIRIAAMMLIVVAFAQPARVTSPVSPDAPPILFLDATASHDPILTGARAVQLMRGNVRVEPGPYFHPALSMFDDPSQGDLRQINARQWWKLEPAGRTTVIARFTNGDPFLIENPVTRAITCALPQNLDWSDLALHPNFVPLIDSMNRYRQQPSVPLKPSIELDFSRSAFVVVLALALLEIALAGWSAWKLPALLALVALTFNPRLPSHLFPAGNPRIGIILDRTDSMRHRQNMIARVMDNIPPARQVELTGASTALGNAFSAFANDTVDAVLLVSDGQHNAGISPAWIAARQAAPVFPVACMDNMAAPDFSVTGVEHPDMVWPSEDIVVKPVITATGMTDSPKHIEIARNNQVILATNITMLTATIPLRGLAAGTHRLELRVRPIAGELSTANNHRPFQITVFDRNIRVWLDANKVNWEFRHILHAMRRDPAVELVTDASLADVVIKTDGETWRMRKFGPDVFQQYWSRRVRLEWLQKTGASLPARLVVSDEPYRLGCHQLLLHDLARISGGKILGADTISRLPDLLRDTRRTGDRRGSWIALVICLGLLTLGWMYRHRSNKAQM